MPQLSLYLDSTSMEMLRHKAKQKNLSLSQYVNGVLHEADAHNWPPDYWNLYGALEDESFTLPKELSFSDDIPRPKL